MDFRFTDIRPRVQQFGDNRVVSVLRRDVQGVLLTPVPRVRVCAAGKKHPRR